MDPGSRARTHTQTHAGKSGWNSADRRTRRRQVLLSEQCSSKCWKYRSNGLHYYCPA
jgi:hypothetical protein